MSNQEDAPSAGVSLSKTRLEAFSDGVFAIATTLLVLDIALHPPGSPLKQVLEAWPYYLAYLVSFLTIGGAWLAHTALTDRLTRADAILLRLNLLVLLGVGFLPFPTRLVAEALHDVERRASVRHDVRTHTARHSHLRVRARRIRPSRTSLQLHRRPRNRSNRGEAIWLSWSSTWSRSSSVSSCQPSPSRSTSASPSISSCHSERSDACCSSAHDGGPRPPMSGHPEFESWPLPSRKEKPLKTHWRASFLLVAVVAVAGGCSSDKSSSSTAAVTVASTTGPSTSGAPASSQAPSATSVGGSDAQLCAARDSLKTSVQGLATAVTSITSTGTSGVQTALDKVKSDLAAVKQQAKSDVAPQVTATETALTNLQTAVTNAGSSGAASVAKAATAFATSATTLLASLSSLKCS